MDRALLAEMANHVALEWAAAAVYLNAAAWCRTNNWDGSASHFASESTEEVGHAHEWATYAAQLGAAVTLGPSSGIGAIPPDAPLVVAYEAALATEQRVLADIDRIATMARETGDTDAVRFCQRFSEAGIKQIAELLTDVATLKRAGIDMAAVQAFDRHKG